jgi:hypothetical protein
MYEDDRSYYQHRATIETELARSATVPSAAIAHHRLAEAYLGKVGDGEPVKVKAS